MKILKYKIFLLLPFIIMSCSNANNNTTNSTNLKSNSKLILMNKYVGDSTAEFNLKTLNNNYLNSKDFLGSYVLVNFWATWCKPCVKEMPSLNKLNSIFKDKKNFKIIAINIGQSKKDVDMFIKNTSKIDFTILLDPDLDLSSWNVKAIPTTFLVNSKGKIIYYVEGEKNWNSPAFVNFFESVIKD